MKTRATMKNRRLNRYSNRSSKRYFGRLPLYCLLPCFAGFTVAAVANDQSEQDAFDQYFGLKEPSDNYSDWTGHLSIGAMVGLNINANFKEGGLFKIPGNNTANGVYNDGYVRTDATGNNGGYTTYWGYDNASQLVGNSLTMHSTTSYSVPNSSAKDEGGPFPGFDLDYGGSFYKSGNFHIGWDLGFDLMPMTITDNSSMSASVNQTAYTFNTGGIVVPGAGYQGSFNGPGPLLNATSTNSSTTAIGTVSGSRSLDVMLYAIRLGPTFYWDFSKNFSASLGIGPAMGIVDAEYKYNELVTANGSSSRNNGSFSAVDTVFGGDINATLLYHTADKARPVDLYLSAQYMPLESADFSQGGREARLNLSGQVYISAGVNWPF
jgi:hypothetical protein